MLRVKNEVGQWVNKHSKHIPEGYPLVTLLVCLVEDAQYPKQMDVMADFLVKQMKVKEYRWAGAGGWWSGGAGRGAMISGQ